MDFPKQGVQLVRHGRQRRFVVERFRESGVGTRLFQFRKPQARPRRNNARKCGLRLDALFDEGGVSSLRNRSRVRVEAHLQPHHATVQIHARGAHFVTLFREHGSRLLKQAARFFELPELAVRNRHHADCFCHLERLSDGFESIVSRAGETNRVAIHVDFEIDFALGEVAEREKPLVE